MMEYEIQHVCNICHVASDRTIERSSERSSDMLSEMSILGIVYTFNVVSSGNMIVQRLNFQFLE